MDPDSSDEIVDHLVDFFDRIAPVYDTWAGGQHGRVASRLVDLADPTTALAEAYRVLRTGGRLAVSCQRRSLNTRAQELFFQGLAPLARRHYLSLPRYSSERARFGEPDVLPQLLGAAGFELTRLTEMVTGGRANGAREWTELMAGAGPLPNTLIRALGPRYRSEVEAGG